MTPYVTEILERTKNRLLDEKHSVETNIKTYEADLADMEQRLLTINARLADLHTDLAKD